MVSTAGETAELLGGAHGGHPAHRQRGEHGRRHAVYTAPSAAANVKEPHRSLAATWRGGKPESSSPSMDQPTVYAVPAGAQKLDYVAIAASQRTCQTTLQPVKSSFLQLQAVKVIGVSPWCDVSTGIARYLIPVQDRQAVFSIFHSLAHAGT